MMLVWLVGRWRTNKTVSMRLKRSYNRQFNHDSNNRKLQLQLSENREYRRMTLHAALFEGEITLSDYTGRRKASKRTQQQRRRR